MRKLVVIKAKITKMSVLEHMISYLLDNSMHACLQSERPNHDFKNNYYMAPRDENKLCEVICKL